MTLVDVSTHAITFLFGAMTGAAGKYLADKFTDQRHGQDARAAADASFKRVQLAMPALIAEMKADLTNNEFAREFAVLQGLPNVTPGRLLEPFDRCAHNGRVASTGSVTSV